jgi:lipopolysaccharide export system permease protein
MKTLDRYIAGQFVFNVAALFVILFSFVVAVDVSLNIDQFLKATDEIARADGRVLEGAARAASAAWIIFDWWWPRLLMLFNFLLGIVMVGAMGFTFSLMAKNRELVAVLAGGMSLHRAGRPVVLAAVGLTGLQVVNQEVFLPAVAPMLTRDHGDAGKRTLGSRGLALTPDGHGRVFAAHLFDADTDALKGLWVLERDESHGARRVITASEARWDAGTGEWVLTGAKVEARQGEPEPGVVDRIATDLDPTMLKMRRSTVFSQNLGTARLTAMLERPGFLDTASREQIERIRLGRFATMGANLLTLIVTMPFFLSRVPGNQMLRSLVCAPVAIAGLIGGVLGASAAIPGLPVWLSVFMPALILVPVAIAMAGALKT